jgi:hypothetical protein
VPRSSRRTSAWASPIRRSTRRASTERRPLIQHGSAPERQLLAGAPAEPDFDPRSLPVRFDSPRSAVRFNADATIKEQAAYIQDDIKAAMPPSSSGCDSIITTVSPRRRWSSPGSARRTPYRAAARSSGVVRANLGNAVQRKPPPLERRRQRRRSRWARACRWLPAAAIKVSSASSRH